MGEERCGSINPVHLIGSNVRCELKAGHEGQHEAHRDDGEWKSAAFWDQDPVDDELRALRKVAEAASRYLNISTIKKSMYWAQQLELHNSLAHWRNLQAGARDVFKKKVRRKATPKRSDAR